MSLTVILRDFLWSLVIFCRQAKKIATSNHIINTFQHTQIQHTYIPWKRQILFVRLNDFCNKCATKLLSSITSVKWPRLWRRISKHNVDFLTKNFIWTNHIFILLEVTWSQRFRNHPHFLYQKSVLIICFLIKGHKHYLITPIFWTT